MTHHLPVLVNATHAQWGILFGKKPKKIGIFLLQPDPDFNGTLMGLFRRGTASAHLDCLIATMESLSDGCHKPLRKKKTKTQSMTYPEK